VGQFDSRHIDRTDAPDTVWHVSSRVNWRTWHLVTEEAFRVFSGCLDRAADRFGVDVIAFVSMSNHYHGVLRSPPEDVFRGLTGRRTACRHFRPYPPSHAKANVIGQCLHHCKLAIAKAIQKSLDLDGHFWDGRHFRRKLVDEADLVVAMAYDHRNPVREAMVARAEDYPRSSAKWWSDGTAAPLPLCRRPDLPFGLSREALRAQLLRAQADARIDDAMKALGESGLHMAQPEGRAELERLLHAAGLDLDQVRHACRTASS
jgi:putative transposase